MESENSKDFFTLRKNVFDLDKQLWGIMKFTLVMGLTFHTVCGDNRIRTKGPGETNLGYFSSPFLQELILQRHFD